MYSLVKCKCARANLHYVVARAVSIRDFKIVDYGWLDGWECVTQQKYQWDATVVPLRRSVFPRFLVVVKTVRIILIEISFSAVY